MGDEPESTTVQVQYDTYGALDKLKERGESFDDVIKRLIDNTAVGMDGLNAYDTAPATDMGEIKSIDTASEPDADKSCAHIDAVSGELCDNDVAYWQPYSFGEGDDGDVFYYCEEHVPGGSI